MLKETVSISPGKLFVQKEDGTWDYLGEAKLAVMPREEYVRLRRVCWYKKAGYAEDDHTRLVEHCAHPRNGPWGTCAWLNCPLNNKDCSHERPL